MVILIWIIIIKSEKSVKDEIKRILNPLNNQINIVEKASLADEDCKFGWKEFSKLN